MSVQGWLRKSSSGMLLRIVARQASDETLSLRLAVTGPALSSARLEASWNVLDWESVPRWQFWIFALQGRWSASPDCWPAPWGTWFLSKSHPAWLQISAGKTNSFSSLLITILYQNMKHLYNPVLFLLKRTVTAILTLLPVTKRILTIDGVGEAALTTGLEFSAFLVTLESKIFFFTTFNSRFLPGT